MNNEPHNWNREDTVRSVKDIINIGRTALAGFVSWAGEVPSRIDTYYANKVNGGEDE